ncbi:MAG: hypothetical protein EA402_04585 [Planctomycetota bacterium]|nr:MAG: hypothetical protein EA402_04585 [Planctomycetota bacterium]
MLTVFSFWAGKQYQKKKNVSLNRGLRQLLVEERRLSNNALHMIAQAIRCLDDPKAAEIAALISEFGDLRDLDLLKQTLGMIVAPGPEGGGSSHT